jgi:hypothetical protein
LKIDPQEEKSPEEFYQAIEICSGDIKLQTTLPFVSRTREDRNIPLQPCIFYKVGEAVIPSPELN